MIVLVKTDTEQQSGAEPDAATVHARPTVHTTTRAEGGAGCPVAVHTRSEAMREHCVALFPCARSALQRSISTVVSFYTKEEDSHRAQWIVR